MKKILVPVDFSDASLNALNAACHFAVRTNASLYVLHVNEMVPYILSVPRYDFPAAAVAAEQYNKEADERIQALKSVVLGTAGFGKLKVEVAVKEGLMISVVKETVKKEGVDLLVMSTLGTSGWKEVFVGSNTERVIRHASCAVLVIPDGMDELKIKRVLVPTTLKPDQRGVFETVKTWQDLLDFDVHLLYVNDPLYALAPGDIEMAKDELVAQTGLRKVTLHRYGQTLYEEEAILHYAFKEKANLIMMGTHQRRGLSHLLFGSITEDTVNHTHVPVLAVPIV
ncbi:MAG: universal stress protein [Saprospiraceae bacterium]|nr:universal stress protein [Saprospiraceae bacterium]MDZ4703516.1 universal stress protein [Saprospiraceae bacterium]